MKAVKLIGPRQLSVVEMDKPAVDGKSAIIQVKTCGICGSDLHFWEYGIGMDGLPGIVMGHEFAGVLEDAGGRNDLHAGDRVTVIPMNPCGECAPCRQGFVQLCINGMKRPAIGLNAPGAYAEYASIRSDLVRKLPDAMTDLSAAMIEPSAVCLRAVRTAGIKAGDHVLIVGGGAIGLLCAAWARISGAATIRLSEVNNARADAATKLADVDEILDGKDPKLGSKIMKATRGGVDIAIDTSASDAGINSAIKSLRYRGTLVLAGISLMPQSLDTLAIALKEAAIKGSFGYQIEEFELAMDYIAGKKLEVEKYISRTVSLEGVQGACETLMSGTSADIKIIIRP